VVVGVVMVVLGHDVDMEYCWSSVDGRGRRESTFLQLLSARLDSPYLGNNGHLA
jgi:hypothetical protein